MIKRLVKLFVASALCCNQASAQKVLLPFGQFTQQSWAASYYFVKNGDSTPSDDWFSKNFNESGWKSIEGPISSENGAPPFYKTLWQAEYGTYYIRRHFTIDRLSDIRDVFFYAIHDDGCVAYLNGTCIYDYSWSLYSYPYYNVVNFDENARKLLVEGDNVLAVSVSDNGGDAYMDNGLYAYSLINGALENYGGWEGIYDRYERDGNTMAYRYGRDVNCQQSISDAPAGLYRLSANACGLEYYDDFNQAWSHKEDEIPTCLFINNDESPLPSAFSETADEDYGWCWDVDGKFVPYSVDGLPIVFRNDMYKCELWSFYDPDEAASMTLGIRGKATNDINRWAAWDNLDLIYYTEGEVTEMLDSIVTLITDLNAKPQNKELSDKTQSLTNEAKAAITYKDKSRAFADIIHHEAVVRKSIQAYEKLEQRRLELAESIEAATDFTSPRTVIEASILNQLVLHAYKNGTYDNVDIADDIEVINNMIVRLGYAYLDISVEVPGAMGDSILARVENFVDVKSLKLSGTLNDADLTTLRDRMTELREIDMTDVNMTLLPNEFFYQHSLLEMVKLPSKLTTIGEYAFYQCYGIKHLAFPSTLTTIKRYAFSECDNLQEVILPEGLVSLGEGAFYSCDNNQSVKLPSSLKAINSYTFYYNTSLRNIEFSEGLTEILYNAFGDCYLLNDVKFPTTLYSIGDNAFSSNRSLSYLVFNEGLYQIGDNAFYDCDALEEITLPSSLVLAYSSPFDWCDNLRKVTCLSIEPPYMTDQIPYGLDMEGRELYVPALSINAYKQTFGWDRFPTIKPIDYLPENISVLGDLKLTLPESIPADYKPNLKIICEVKDGWNEYGSLTINGDGVLSLSSFSMMFDPETQYNYRYYDRNKNHCSLVNNSHLRADNVSVDIETQDGIWAFITVPFDAKVSDIQTTGLGSTNWVIRRYDGQKRAAGETSETWVKMSGEDMLNAGEGYIIQGSHYIDGSRQYWSSFRINAINNGNKNNIFASDDVEVTLNAYESEFAHNRSWNLIGNPYPCYYDTRFMDFDAPITVWDMNDRTYRAYSPSDDQYILCPGEAFFVQRPVEDGTILFSKDGRQINREVRMHNALARAKSTDYASRIIVNLNFSDGKNTDRTRIVLNEEATLQYEMDKDASKFMSTELSVPQVYTLQNSVKYAINERPLADGSVVVGLHAAEMGTYSLSLANEVKGCKVILEDMVEHKSIILSEVEGYDFSVKGGDIENRFVLHFVADATGVEEIQTESKGRSAIYSIDGIKMDRPSKKGLYIQDGKKIMLNK